MLDDPLKDWKKDWHAKRGLTQSLSPGATHHAEMREQLKQRHKAGDADAIRRQEEVKRLAKTRAKKARNQKRVRREAEDRDADRGENESFWRRFQT